MDIKLTKDDIIILDHSSEAIEHLCCRDKRLARVINDIGPISYTLHSNYYEFMVSQIINQMLSNTAANSIFSRMLSLCGGNITPQIVSELSDAQIKSIGTSDQKVLYIRELTNALERGQLDFERIKDLDDIDVISELRKVKGIGAWSAKMFLIFALGRPNVLPFEDVAFLQSYKWLYKTNDIKPESIMRKCKKWAPYSSIATRYLYKALDEKLTKSEFHLFK